MTPECDHWTLKLSCLEDTVHQFDTKTKGWIGSSEPTGFFYVTSGHCKDCDTELTLGEIMELTNLPASRMRSGSYLEVGDKDNEDSYIVVMLNREELIDTFERFYGTTPQPTTEDGWRDVALKVGSKVWGMLTESGL